MFKFVVIVFLSQAVLLSANEKKEEKAPPPVEEGNSDGYVHKWLEFPKIVGLDALKSETLNIEPTKGKMLVVFFLASWCEPCQKMVRDFQLMEQRHRKVRTQFNYVFCHDTKKDAFSFAKENGLSTAIMADHEVLKNFHNPELPSIYYSDRKGWLAGRYLKATKKDLDELHQTIDLFSAL